MLALVRRSLVAVGAASFALSVGCGFSEYKCKSMQSEAKAKLMALKTVMESVKTEKGAYPKSIDEAKAAGFDATGQYYDFRLGRVDAAAFSAEAVGKDKMAGDVWQVDQTGMPKAVTDKCK